jgi:toxin YhaV
MLVVNGWHLIAHPLFLDQLEKLSGSVARSRESGPRGWRKTANAKLLAALRQLVFETIPQEPTRPEYRQGGTLGNDRKHWFRAKFGGGRFRLFFRFSTSAKVIIFAWVNDANTLRTYGSKSDAYAVFRKMLDKGNPPDV